MIELPSIVANRNMLDRVDAEVRARADSSSAYNRGYNDGYGVGWDEAINEGNKKIYEQMIYTGQRRVERDKALAERDALQKKFDNALGERDALQKKVVANAFERNRNSVCMSAFLISLAESMDDPRMAASLDPLILRFAQEYERLVSLALDTKTLKVPPHQDPTLPSDAPRSHARLLKLLARAEALRAQESEPGAEVAAR